MKYLKRYNEELRPEVYKRAGQILKNTGKTERGSKLIDYHDELAFGFFNIITSDGYKYVVTRPKSEFFYGDIINNNRDVKKDLEIKIKSADELIEAWLRGGSDLSFTINIEFTKKDEPGSITYDKRAVGMSLHVVLNSWQSGKEDFEEDFDLDNLDINDFYNDSNESGTTEVYLKRGLYSPSYKRLDIWDDFVLFSDRKSALKFKRLIPEIINQYKENIMEIFSIIGTDIEEWDNLIESVKNIRVNKLYVDTKSDTKTAFKNIIAYPLN